MVYKVFKRQMYQKFSNPILKDLAGRQAEEKVDASKVGQFSISCVANRFQLTREDLSNMLNTRRQEQNMRVNRRVLKHPQLSSFGFNSGSRLFAFMIKYEAQIKQQMRIVPPEKYISLHDYIHSDFHIQMDILKGIMDTNNHDTILAKTSIIWRLKEKMQEYYEYATKHPQLCEPTEESQSQKIQEQEIEESVTSNHNLSIEISSNNHPPHEMTYKVQDDDPPEFDNKSTLGQIDQWIRQKCTVVIKDIEPELVHSGDEGEAEEFNIEQ